MIALERSWCWGPGGWRVGVAVVTSGALRSRRLGLTWLLWFDLGWAEGGGG